MKIKANLSQLIGKLVFIPVAIFVGWLFVTKFNSATSRVADKGFIYIIIIGGTLMACFFLLVIAELLFFPIGVFIDREKKQISFQYLLSASVSIHFSEINAYSTTSIRTKAGRYDGIFIFTTNNRKYFASDFNLKNHLPVRALLDEINVTNTGEEKFRPVSYIVKYGILS